MEIKSNLISRIIFVTKRLCLPRVTKGKTYFLRKLSQNNWSRSNNTHFSLQYILIPRICIFAKKREWKKLKSLVCKHSNLSRFYKPFAFYFFCSLFFFFQQSYKGWKGGSGGLVNPYSKLGRLWCQIQLQHELICSKPSWVKSWIALSMEIPDLHSSK